ncbi:hypothetical protein ABES03_08695 [Neobacillus rhizosphaerae]
MNANLIIDYLLDKIKVLTRENAFLYAQVQTLEEQLKAEPKEEKGAEE